MELLKILLLVLLIFVQTEIKLSAQVSSDSILQFENSIQSLDNSSKIKILNELSWYYRAIKPEKSIEYAKSGINLARKTDDKKSLATFYNILGVTNNLIGNFEISLDYHFKGLSIREANNDTAGIAASLNNIGLVYEKLDDFKRAFDYYNRSLKLKRTQKNQNAVVIGLNNVGYALRKLGKLNEALPYYLEALKLDESLNDKVGLSLTYSNLGLLYREKKLFQNALDYSFRSLRLREEITDISGVTLQNFILGTIYFNQNNFKEAQNYFFRSMNLAKRHNFRPEVKDNYQMLSQLYKNRGDYKSAFKYFEMFSSLRDSLINEDKNKRIIELQEVYQSKQREAEIQKLQLEKVTQFRNYSIAFIIFFILVTAVFFNRYRISRKLLNSLAESEKFNSDLINNIPEYLFLFDGWKIIYSNKLVQNAFGYTKEEFENLQILDIIDKEYHELIKQNKLLRESGKSIPPYEVVGITKSGNRKNLLIRSMIIQKDKSIINLVLCSDITELKNYERELIISKEKAEKSDRLKSEFLAQISHEIRTPLNVILSWASMLENDLKDMLGNENKEAFEIIHLQGNRTIRTIELILNMSEIQIGSYEPIFKKTDFENDILLKILPEIKLEAERNGLSFSYQRETTNGLLFVDEYSISQSLRNVLENAVKFTKTGSIEVKIFRNSENEFCFSVTDTGIGISEEYLPYLFMPFRQEQQGYTRMFEGNGLGLALTKKYLELNNAEISVSSKKDFGSTFTIRFRNS